MQNDMLHFGILGTGAIARCMADNLPGSRRGRLVAVGSRSADGAAAFTDKYGVRGHGSYEALLADPDVDAVYVTTPHPLHAEWTIKAARAGKHVLCEKPFALNAAEADAMLDAARQAGVTVMEAFMYRCHPQTQELVRLLREKAVGDVKLVRASFGFTCGFDPKSRLWSAELAGGGIMDVGCYAVSAARLVAGAAVGKDFDDPEQVVGLAALAATGVDAHAAGVLKFASGIVAQVSTSIDVRQPEEIFVFGTEGTIYVPRPWAADRSHPVQGRIVVTRDGVAREIDIPVTDNTFAMEVDRFAEAVASGTGQAASPAMTWADTLGQAKTLDQWRAAAGVVYPAETAEHFPQTTAAGESLRAEPGGIPHGRIAGLDKPVSRLVLGCDNQRTLPGQAAIADAFFEAGGNTFDTGHIYAGGLQERLLGQWMRSRGVRDACVVIAKGAHTPYCTPDDLKRQLRISLERLQIDTADIYLMHRDNLDVPVGEFVDVLNEETEAGRMRVFGGSNWSLARVVAANDYAKSHGLQGLAAVSNNFSLARMVDPPWGLCVSSSDDASRQWFETTKTALLPWSSQAQGFFVPGRADPAKTDDAMLSRCWYSADNFERLRRAKDLAGRSGVDVREVALAYVLGQAFPVFALIGPRTIAELRSSLPGLKVKLSEADLKWLDLRE